MIDNLSLEWLAVKKRCEAQIKVAQEMIETAGLDPVQTELYRGRLQAFREVLDFPDQPDQE